MEVDVSTGLRGPRRRGGRTRRRCFGWAVWLLAAGVAGAGPARGEAAATDPPWTATEEREACAAHDPQRRPFFGDTHVHTAFSQDASTQGTRNTPRDAYRFARGSRSASSPTTRTARRCAG